MERSCIDYSSFSCNETEDNVHEDHLQFIQAIIQLKSAAKIGNSLPVNEFNEIISGFPQQCKQIFPISTDNVYESSSGSRTFISQDVCDSGVGSSVTEESANEQISTTTISYLIRSSTIAKHIFDSVLSVTNYLYSCLFFGSIQTLEKCICNWKGSLIEVAVNVIVELVNLANSPEDHNYCRACSDFITRVIDFIFMAKDVNVYSVLEYRCVIVSELSNSQYLCEAAIHSIMKRIEDMSQKMKRNRLKDTLQQIEEAVIASHEYDTSFYMLHLLERLLKKWREHCIAFTQTDEFKKTTYFSITEMWKKTWGNSVNCEQGKTMKNLWEKWSTTLEEATHNTMDEFPNFSFLTWSCLQILEPLGSHLQNV
ncbi:hypothetical protein R5R35_011074 [Gryllus longicercus]|uniref:Uncharacterized protein n=1 Tax=Gryllus longicercus TaxID=2509291 RepID=A0AAN9WB32_9ORTH